MPPHPHHQVVLHHARSNVSHGSHGSHGRSEHHEHHLAAAAPSNEASAVTIDNPASKGSALNAGSRANRFFSIAGQATVQEDIHNYREYVHCHAQASQCLLPTQEGVHPAIALIRQKGLICSHVAKARADESALIFQQVSTLPQLLKCGSVSDLDQDGKIDQYEFRQLVLSMSKTISDEGMTKEEADILMHFIPVDEALLLAESQEQLTVKLKVALVLWLLSCKHREQWRGMLHFPLTASHILEVMMALNGNERVEEREAQWLINKIRSMTQGTDELKLLMSLAYWYSTAQALPKEGIKRDLLIQRIELERKLRVGFCRCILWVGVFMLLTSGLIVAGKQDECRGIRANLEAQLQLENLGKVTSVKEVRNFVTEFSRLSASFSPLSRVYFGGGNVWIVQQGTRHFQGPEPLPSLMEPSDNEDALPQPLILGQSFTLQAWVQFNPDVPLPASGVPIMRRPLGQTGEEARLSCWNWQFPLSISYGAHDYGGSAPDGTTGLLEDFVSVPYNVTEEYTRSVMHTILVSPTNVTFMVDDRVVDTVALPRPLTDCTGQDVYLGGRGLTLTAVSVYPQMLSTTEVEQIFRAGATMRNIGYIISPQKMKSMDQVSRLNHGVTSEIRSLKMTTRNSQDATWVASAMTSASLKTAAAPTPYVSADHPIGTLTDPVTGYPYWEIYGKPVYTDHTSKNLANGTLLPDPSGSAGFTLSSWLQLDTNTGSGYFMAMSMPFFIVGNPHWSGWMNYCWMFWVGASYTGIYTRSGAGAGDGPTYFVADLEAPREWRFKGKSYRHIVFQVAPGDTESPLRVCIDGVCTGQATINAYAELTNTSFPPAASCAQTGLFKSYTTQEKTQAREESRIYLNRRPMNNYPMIAWQMSTKYFDRVLTEAEIQKLFNEDPDTDSQGKSIRETRGCKLSSEMQDDSSFRDYNGNDCFWYFTHKREKPELCMEPGLIRACPMSCEAEVCWGNQKFEASTMQIWKQQLEVRTRGQSGTMCVGQSTTPEAEAIKCGLNAPNFSNCASLKAGGAALDCGPRDCSGFLGDRAGLVGCLANTRWVPESGNRFDFFPLCRDIVELAMPSCAWDDSGLDAIATDINASRSWSLSFWFESISMREDCLQPQLRLLNGDGGTFSWLGGMDRNVDDLPAGSGWQMGCQSSTWLAHGPISPASGGYVGGKAGSMSADLQAPFAKPGKKHFVLLGRKPDGSIGLQFNERENSQSPPSTGLAALPPDRSFLRVINIGGSLRISPLVLRPYYPDAAEIGFIRATQQLAQDRRMGPALPLQQSLKQKLPRTPETYSQKTMMLAPPFLVQARHRTGPCASDISEKMVTTLQQLSTTHQCSGPYTCPAHTIENIYTCPDKTADAEDEYFGHQPILLNRQKVYIEYLASIADNAVLVRPMGPMQEDGRRELTIRNTQDFLDLLTKKLDVLALFFSVEFSITSMLKISFTMANGRVHGSYVLDHIAAISGSQKSKVTAILIICMALAVIVVLDLVLVLKKQFSLHGRTKKWDWSNLYASICDALLAVLTMIMVAVNIRAILASESDTHDYIMQMSQFDWMQTGGTQDLQRVKSKFMDRFNIIQDRFNAQNQIMDLTRILAIFLLLRVILCTGAHPRIEMITKTIEKGMSDLLHFFMLLVVIFAGLAVLGMWLFGSEREELSTVPWAIFSLWDGVLGPPGSLEISRPHLTPSQIFYIFLFHFICFFFLLNFVLAIIVDSYTKVMDAVRECVVDQDIASDMWSISKYQMLLYRWAFPLRRVIIQHLKNLDLEVLTADDLRRITDSSGKPIFESPEAATAFYKHYEQYDFLWGSASGRNASPTPDDLAMLMALTLNKLESIEHRLEHADHSVQKLIRPSGQPAEPSWGQTNAI